MHASFIRLLLASRALGSNFWLSTAVVSSSVLSFILALPLSHYFEIPLDPISLTEALPFLVCTVGFDKQLRLAKAVFNHSHLTTPVKEGRWRGQMKPAGEVVFEAMESVGNLILRDYGLEIAALLLGARSKVGGLKEFCALAALTLVLDCLVFGTFYAAVLTIMVEVSCFCLFVYPIWVLPWIRVRVTHVKTLLDIRRSAESKSHAYQLDPGVPTT